MAMLAYKKTNKRQNKTKKRNKLKQMQLRRSFRNHIVLVAFWFLVLFSGKYGQHLSKIIPKMAFESTDAHSKLSVLYGQLSAHVENHDYDC